MNLKTGKSWNLNARVFYGLFAIMLPFFVLTANAQSKTVTGTVNDSDGLPLISVSVVEKGTLNGVLTGDDGSYSITLNGANPVLEFIYTGFNTQEIEVGNRTQIDVVLLEGINALDEVVVIGYGTQRKADVTSAVTNVKAESFNKGSVLDVGQLVQGKVAGLQISLPSGDPNASTSVMLRGSSTLQGGRDPLILVDGVPGSFSTVSPEDVESIDVLKDGSATAIYGTRGTNGVIIITTRGGGRRETPATIDYNGYLSIQHTLKRPDFMDASDMRRHIADGYKFNGVNSNDYGASTDWVDEITRTGISHVHNLTFRGGGKQTNILANLTYENREGTMKRSERENIRGRLELTHRMFDDKLITSIYMVANESKYFYNNYNYIYRQATIQNPTQPIYDENGKYTEPQGYFYVNPVAQLNEVESEYRNRNIRFTGTMEYKPIQSLSLKGMVTRKGQSSINGYYETHNHPSTTRDGINGYASRYTSDYRNNLIELTATWNEKFDKHRISAVAGYTYEDNVTESFSVNNRNFPTDAYLYNNLGTGLGLSNGTGGMASNKYKDKLIGVFARAMYNYDDRYLLTVSIRREGSTKFGNDHKWGNFPGISAGWRLSEESFMKDVKWLDNLKIRAGFGVTGTNISSSYQSLASLNYSGYFLYNGSWINTLVPARNPNPNLKWEKKYEYNFGFDADLFNGRLSGAIDVYLRDTKDALWNYAVPSPPYQYTSIMANAGEIRNSGVEIMVNAVPVRTKDFEWSTNVTFSYNKNELRALGNDQFPAPLPYFEAGGTGEPIQTYTHRNVIGGPIGDFWGLKSVGLDSDGKWVVQRFERDDDGNIIGSYYDKAENAKEEDKQYLGNGVPTTFLNWNNQFRYKGFDLSINMRGAFGYEILNFQKMYYGNPTIGYNMLNSAFDGLPVVDLATGNSTGQSTIINDAQRYVSEYIEKGNYWKINNVTLGYSFDVNKIKYIKRLRIYASCLNLATITGYSGIDPEVRMTGNDPGIDDRDKYPTVRTYTFGVNITF